VTAFHGGHGFERCAQSDDFNDGRRTLGVLCTGCQASAEERLPIGIGMPLESRLTAETLRENHKSRPFSNLS
jgi:hypothetical protein